MLIPAGDSSTTLSTYSTPCDVLGTKDQLCIQHRQPFHQVINCIIGDFETYLDLLPEWERLLLSNIQSHTDIFTTAQLLNEDNIIMNATSDRSAPNLERSFRWSAKTTSGIIIVSNKGAP